MRRLFGAILLSMATLPVCLPGGAGSSVNLTGDWEGVLAVHGADLPLVLHPVEERGRLRASLDSPEQRAFGLEVTDAEVQDGGLSFRVPSVGGRFRGKLHAGHSEIRGIWRQGAFSLPITFRRLDVAAGASKRRLLQEPRLPLSYRAETLIFTSAAEGITLAGTLTSPCLRSRASIRRWCWFRGRVRKTGIPPSSVTSPFG